MLSVTTGWCQISIGAGTNEAQALPIDPYFGYSYGQSIYLASEIGPTTTITGIRWNFSGAAASTIPNSQNITVYIGHTAKTTFTSTTDWEPVANLTQKFTGGIVVNGPGVATIMFTTPFVYDGTSNLIIAVDENMAGYDASTDDFLNFAATDRSIFYKSDTVNPDPFAPPTGTRASFVPNIVLLQPVLTVPNCATGLTPANLATGVVRNPVLTWTAATGGPSSYDVYFGTSVSPGLVANTVSTSYTPVAPLLASTTYYWKVVAKNAIGDAVGCTTQSFTTGTSATYCVPTTTSGCTDGDVIARVTLNTLDNDSGTGCPSGLAGYSDYTGNGALTTTLQAGTSYGCTVYAGEYSEGYAAWIDYNDDGTFNNATERIGYSAGQVAGSGSVGVLGSSATFPIVLACNPPLGQHRLRVRAMFSTNGSAVTPCTNNGYGEVEDYLITISAAVACPQPSALGTSAITATTATLTWNIGCAETAWDVYLAVAGGPAPGAPTHPAVTSPLAVTGLTVGTNYVFYVRADCAANGTSLWTGPFAFSTLPNAPDCSVLVSPADAATDVPLIGGDAVTLTWNAPATGAAPTGYNIYFGTAPGSLTLLGNAPTPTANITAIDYSTTYYWQIVPTNAGGPAVGCTTIFSFTTEAQPAAPANDDCTGSIPLTAGGVFGDYPEIVSNISATDSAPPTPGCASYLGGDVWYTVEVPASGSITIETNNDTAGGSPITDTGLAVYSGADCSSLTLVECDDDDSTDGAFSKISLTGRAEGELLFINTWQYDNDTAGTFKISAYDASLLSAPSFDMNGFSAYPNPVKDILNLAYTKNISSISVHNLLGQEVMSKTINATHSQVDLSRLSGGTYLVKVTVDGLVKTIKVVKQ